MVAVDVLLGFHERRLLGTLSECGGLTASEVARVVGWTNLRRGAQIERRFLDDLCAKGLACRTGDLRPVRWVRTGAGTLALGGR